MTEAFPIRPVPENDRRYNGLLVDALELLERHGYPIDSMTNKDRAEFALALWRFLYGERQS